MVVQTHRGTMTPLSGHINALLFILTVKSFDGVLLAVAFVVARMKSFNTSFFKFCRYPSYYLYIPGKIIEINSSDVTEKKYYDFYETLF